MKLFKIDKTDFALGNCLFGAVSLNKTAEKDKFGYIGFGIGFDVCLSFSLSYSNGYGKNAITILLSIVYWSLMIIREKIS